MIKIRFIFICALFLLFASQTASASMMGKVISISDGDTITVLDSNKAQHKIRLAEIDTPEKGQPYGQKAKDALAELVFGKAVNVKVIDKDRYGRLVGHIYLDELHVNKEMVRIGAAWVYRQYLKDKSLLAVESEAKAARRGLWGLSEAQNIPPWEWRKGQRSSPVKAGVYKKCGTKTYCRDMRDCEEALYFLNTCGLTRLDGDNDGMPCEKLCSSR